MQELDLYKHIKNPLDNPATINELLLAYGESGNFYSRLMGINSKEGQVKYNGHDMNYLHSLLFNSWKNSLISMNSQQLEESIKANKYDKSIYKLVKYLKSIPNIRTHAEAVSILNKHFEDEELRDAMSKYRWDSYGEYREWTYINSEYIYATENKNTKKEHKLYLNPRKSDIHKLSKLFIDKCNAAKLPFDFKIAEYNAQDDSFVIYSDTKNLGKYINILKSIEKEAPEIIASCSEPPILTGRIKNWLGYGSETRITKEKDSFNGIRSRVIEKAIEEEMILWYRAHKNIKIKSSGKTTTIIDYLSTKIADKEIKIMIDRLGKDLYLIGLNSEKNGFYLEDLSSPNFCDKMRSQIKKNLPQIMETYLESGQLNTSIIIPLSKTKSYTVYNYRIKDELKRLIPVIIKTDVDFEKRVMKRIKNISPKLGIDPENYCFDLGVKERVISDLSKEKQTEPEKNISKEASKTPLFFTPYTPMTAEEIAASREKLAFIENKSETTESDKTPTPEQIFPQKVRLTSVYTPMTDAEIDESRKKIGVYDNNFIIKKIKNTKEKMNANKAETYSELKTPYVYTPMTDEQILASRKLLGLYDDCASTTPNKNNAKESVSATASQVEPENIYVYTPMTDTEIFESRKKIGEYIQPKVKSKIFARRKMKR